MSKNKGKTADPAVALQAAQAANTVAAAPSVQTQKLNDYDSKLWDIYTGKDSFDLAKLPNSNVLMNLYDQAHAQHDAGRVGTGLNYGEGGNPAQIAGIREQNAMEKDLIAKGELEGRVADTFNGLEGRMMGLGAVDQENRNNAASRATNMYGIQLNAPQKKKWWESLLGGVANVASSYVSGGLAAS